MNMTEEDYKGVVRSLTAGETEILNQVHDRYIDGYKADVLKTSPIEKAYHWLNNSKTGRQVRTALAVVGGEFVPSLFGSTSAQDVALGGGAGAFAVRYLDYFSAKAQNSIDARAETNFAVDLALGKVTQRFESEGQAEALKNYGATPGVSMIQAEEKFKNFQSLKGAFEKARKIIEYQNNVQPNVITWTSSDNFTKPNAN